MVVKLRKDGFTGDDIEVEVPEGVFKLDCFDPMEKKSYVKYYYFEYDKNYIREAKEVKVEYVE